MPSLTAIQRERAHEVFALFDKKKEGTIATEDLGNAVRACGRNPTNADVLEMIEQVDASNTGKVSRDTFLQVLERPLGRADDEEEVKSALKVFDKSGTGFVSVSEIRHILTSLGEKLTSEEVDELIRDADVDDNGNLNIADFVGMVMPSAN